MKNENDATYVGEATAAWAKRYLTIEDKNKIPKTHEKVVGVLDANDNFTTDLKLGNHYLKGDEPPEVGGNDFGPNPYEFVSGGLAACTAMTIRMYADRKQWNVEQIKVFINHEKESRKDVERQKHKKLIYLKEIFT